MPKFNRSPRFLIVTVGTIAAIAITVFVHPYFSKPASSVVYASADGKQWVQETEPVKIKMTIDSDFFYGPAGMRLAFGKAKGSDEPVLIDLGSLTANKGSIIEAEKKVFWVSDDGVRTAPIVRVAMLRHLPKQ